MHNCHDPNCTREMNAPPDGTLKHVLWFAAIAVAITVWFWLYSTALDWISKPSSGALLSGVVLLSCLIAILAVSGSLAIRFAIRRLR
jgi:hypothetical protein